MFKHLVIIYILLVLGGCAMTQEPIALSPEFKTDTNHVIGIAVAKLPEGNTHETGGMGLVDIVIVNEVMSPLTDHLKTLDFTELYEIKDMMDEKLKESQKKTVVINEPLDLEQFSESTKKDGFADRDFTSLKEQYDIDTLLLVTVKQVGTTRDYYGFLPLTDPQTYINSFGQIINLSDNSLIWHHNEEIIQPVTGDWDEQETGYPNITNGVYQALDLNKTNIVNNLEL